MNIAEQIIRAKTDYDEVYEAGKRELVEIHPEVTVSGSYISLDDVSELPHEVKCKVSGVDNPEAVQVMRCGRNLLNPDNFRNGEFVEYNGIQCYKYRDNATYFVYEGDFIPNTQYTLSFKLYAEDGNKSLSTGVFVIYTDGTNNRINVFSETEQTLITDAGKTVAKISGAYNNNRALYIDLSYTRLSLGTTALPYEPYNGQTLTPATDGTVEGMTSVSPYMNIFTNTEDANLEVIYRQSKGIQTEYNRFWDSFQDNGKRTSYRGAFCGGGWDVNTFKPKYAIAPTTTNAVYMFMFCNYSGAENLNYQNYKHLFNFSKISSAANIFQDAWIDYIEVDFSNATTLINAFTEGYTAGHKTHITLKVSNKCTIFTSAFGYCTSLTDLTFTEGSEIVANISFSSCPLTAESIVSVVEHLSDSDDVTGKTATFKQTAINNADWSTTNYANWDELKATKPNWAFAYA